FVLLGPPADGMYGGEDLEYLQGMAALTTLALQSAETQETLERLNEELRDKVAKVGRQQRQQLLAPLLDRPRDDGDAPTEGRSAGAPAAVDPGELRGGSDAMQRILSSVRKIADSHATVLVRGESGTGKSLLAEVLHRNSARAKGPFVKVHCAALAPMLLESELFGHVKGAFTGAHRDKVGRFQLGHKGTIFLDEIGDVTLETQTKLLRVLQESAFEPVGSSETMTVDVRIIAATHQPLEELIRRGRFREDLFYRLNVISLMTPALRDRRDDVPELALYFLQRYAQQAGKQVVDVSDDALDLMRWYDWPGNIRELENVVERAVVMTAGPEITPEDLPPELHARRPGGRTASEGNGGATKNWPAAVDAGASLFARAEAAARREAGSLVDELDEVERQRLVDALRNAGGNKARASRLLGIPRTTFSSKLRKFGLG
ncbi:MAG: sigma-54 interaction domain-containing protein, partial [Planctomycetia bacterium]